MFRNLRERMHFPSATTRRDASLAPHTRSQALFDMDKLAIPPRYRSFFQAVNLAVRDYMNGAAFDPSHDYEHIQRVIALAHRIYTKELSRRSYWVKNVDPMVMYLAAMMHEVGDPEYLAIGHRQEEDIQDMLLHCNVPLPLARQVEYLIPRVSFSREKACPDIAMTECEDYPALKIIQDAAWLDTLGAVGRGGCFVFGGANEGRRGQSMQTGIQMNRTQFERVLRSLKTETGRREAEKWWKRMEKTDISSVI